MNLQPQTENGRRLANVVSNWIKLSPEFAVDKLKRMLLTYSLELKNKDGFVGVLYGQNVLDESPPILVKIEILF